jgi:hypothetical protein
VSKTGHRSLGSLKALHRRSLPLPRTVSRCTARLKFLADSSAYDLPREAVSKYGLHAQAREQQTRSLDKLN